VELIFWASIACLAYVCGGYLIMLWGLQQFVSLWQKRRTVEGSASADDVPLVSVIIAAYNEAASIERRIENLRTMEYPASRLEVIVASDGSTDETVDKARRAGASVLAFPERRGRTLVHNAAVAGAAGGILLFTDAQTSFAPNFVNAVVAHFADPTVGGVAARLSYRRTDSDVTAMERLYIDYEMKLREAESALGLLVIGSGACIAIRKDLFVPMSGTQDIDNVAGLNAVAKGYRFVHEARARAWDVAPDSVRSELRVRARTSAKAWGIMSWYSTRFWLTHPAHLGAFVSHRVARSLMPIWLILAWISSCWLAGSAPIYRLALWSQAAFYAAAALAAIARALGRRIPVASVALGICAVNAGFLLGLGQALLARAPTTYEPHEPRPA
jgi:cellulose synthase/poly-beta-1,6-N-acetylglucosamine synthase-like glycosyltransferase